MKQSEENIRKIEDAAISGKYQIVCRQVFGSLNSWYITNSPTTEWNWSFNEYRIYVGCDEPPMTNKMNDYSVYYCGYNYYFIEEDGKVKKQININVAQDCESSPYFKSNHILSDKITPLEGESVVIENLKADGLKADGIFTDKVNPLNGKDVEIENLKTNEIFTNKISQVGNNKIQIEGLVDLIYPVGSIYMSVNNVSPASFLGGSWEQIKDTFLLTAGDKYSAGSTGGEATHKLTEEEMPSHSHTTNGQSDEESGSMNGHATGSVTSSLEGLFNGLGDLTTTGNMSVSGSTSWAGGDNDVSNRPTTLSIDVSHTHDILHTHTTETKGKSSAHNNMPPYLAVYCWKRVS